MLMHKVPWFQEAHECFNSSDEFLNYAPIKNYLEAVETGIQPVSDEVHSLIDNIIPIICDMLDKGEIYMDKTMSDKTIAVPATAFPYALFDWEAFLVPFMVGLRFSDDDTLVYDEYFMYMARGAGKNGFMSWLIFVLISKVNGIPHYDVAVSASSERQAKTSFTDIYTVLTQTDPDNKVFRRTKTEIEHRTTKSIFQFLSSNGKTADGLRLGALYLDEIHAIDSYEMLNVLKSSLGKIPDARIFITTTDGYTRGSVLDEYKETGRRVLKGDLGVNYPKDDLRHSRMLPFMCCINDINDAKNEQAWYKANPSLRFNAQLLQQYRKEVVQIDRNAELNIEFHCKRVNFPKEDNRFSIATYEELQETRKRSIEDYIERTGDNEVYGVVDYSSTRDLTSVGIVAHDMMEDEYYYNHESFITHTMYSSGVINNEILTTGQQEGKLNIVYTKTIEVENVVNYFIRMSHKYYIHTIFIDQFKSTILKPALEAAGFIVVKIETNMKYETLVAPLLDKMFTQNKMFAGEDSLFRWAVGNLYKQILSKGLRYDKIEPKARKTDPASAFIAGLIGMLDAEPDQPDTFAGKVIS